MSKSTLEKACTNLFRKEPFWGHFLLKFDKVITTKIPTAAVTVKKRPIMYINPYFFQNLSEKEQIDVLKHEMCHIAYDHLKRAEVYEIEKEELTDNSETTKIADEIRKMIEASDWNKAQDIAINQMLPNIPKKFKLFDVEGNSLYNEHNKSYYFESVNLENLREQCEDVEIKADQNAEYYYEFIKKNSLNDKLKKFITLDSHKKLSEEDQDLVDKIVRKALKESAEQAGPGNLPGELSEEITKLFKPSRTWEDEIHDFVSQCIETETHRTRRKKNRRYGWNFPGSKYDPKNVLVVAVDTSASVDIESLTQIFTEINKIHESNVDVIVIQCDVEINNVKKYDPNDKIELNGRGGTSFEPVFEYIESEEFTNEYGIPTGLIYFTDGGDLGNCKEPNLRILWALTPNCDVHYDWGQKVWISLNNG